jgi:hypothetical protein
MPHRLSSGNVSGPPPGLLRKRAARSCSRPDPAIHTINNSHVRKIGLYRVTCWLGPAATALRRMSKSPRGQYGRPLLGIFCDATGRLESAKLIF